MICAESVSRIYGHAGNQISALREVNLDIKSSERVAIVGKSGSGKSTLLNLFAGMDRPTSGTLSIDGQRLDQMNRREMADYRCKTVGIIFQSFQLLPHHSALRNVEMPLALAGVRKRERREQSRHWLNRVGLSDREGHLPYALSGGQQQRVAIARAMVHQPRLLLADEPTGNLDSSTAEQIEQLIVDLCDETGATFVLVTHDERLADRCSNQCWLMADGQLSPQAIVEGESRENG